MMQSIAFEPFLPAPVLAAAAAVALLAAGLGVWRGGRGWPLRALGLAALFALLLNPLLRRAETTPLSDIVVLLLDRSASQRLDGRFEAGARAADELETRLKTLEGVEIVRREVMGEDETALVGGLEAALADAPRGQLSGVFLVTDGQASDAARLAGVALEAPAHLFLTGRATETDRKLTLINAPRYGIVRESVAVSFRVDDVGAGGTPVKDAAAARVVLRINGAQVLAQDVPLGAEASFAVPLDQPGALVIELEAAARPGELTERNNVAVLTVTAIRDRLRVLLISGEPHAGERVWRNLLKSDPAVDLIHFTILRPIDKGSPFERAEELALIPFPQDELFIDKLAEFDLVIFDRYAYRGVLNAYHFDNIARYVENGGAVLVAAGPEYAGPDSLARQRNISFLLPALPSAGAREGAFRPELTGDGARHPVTEGLPDADFWGRWLRIVPAEARAGMTLMQDGAGAPLLILDRVGKGRVGLLLSDHVWLWARGFDGGGPHTELLRRIAHWLMKEPELEEEQLALADRAGDLLVRRRTMADEAGEIELADPLGQTRPLRLDPKAPGLFEALVPDAARGVWRARAGGLFAVGAVGVAAPREFEDVVSVADKLAPLVERSRGGIFAVRRGADIALPAIRRIKPGAAAYAGPGWAGIAARDAARTDAVSDEPVAPPFAWLLLFAFAFAGAWWLEGRGARSAGARSRTRSRKV